MRTNYKRIKNILSKNYPDAFQRPARTKGVVLGYYDLDDMLNGVPEGSEQCVRIVLVDYAPNEACSIVIHSFDASELEGLLVDAITTAFKDGFTTIFIQQSRVVRDEPERDAKALKGWLEMFSKSSGGDYSLNQLKRKYGLSAEAVFASFTAEQRTAVMSLIAAAYNTGCDQTRESFRKFKEQRELAQQKGA